MKTTRNKKQQGFTLIELLVVVTVLAALAGITSVAMDGYQQDAEEQITRVEMQRIANAIRRFKADTGYWPKTESSVYTYQTDNAADFSFLFNNPNNELQEWSPEYAIGWHGPYIDLPAKKTIAFDNTTPLDKNKILCSTADDLTIQSLTRVDGLVDKFEQVRNIGPDTKYCKVVTKEKVPSEYKIPEISGSPYFYNARYWSLNHDYCNDVSSSCIALVSSGSDGVDGTDQDNSDGILLSDDIVFVLEVN